MRPPEIDTAMFIAGAEKMFALFPIEACREVADPGRGYPATERFAPTLAELRIALEDTARPHRLRHEREARAQALAQARAAEQSPQEPRPSYAELQRRCATLGLVIGGKGRARGFDADAESERVRAQYGISREAWDALPRASA